MIVKILHFSRVAFFSFVSALLLLPLSVLAQNSARIDSLLLSLKINQDQTATFQTLSHLAFEFWQTRPDTAIAYGSKALIAGKRINAKGQLARPYSFIGLAYMKMSNYTKANENFQASLKVSLENKDDLQIAHSYNNFGRLFLELSDTDEAFNFFYKGLTIFKKVNQQPDLAHAYRSLMLYYDQTGQYDSAIFYARRVLLIREKLPRKELLVTALNDISQLYRKNGEFDMAKTYLAQADNIVIGLNDMFRLMDTRINLIEVLLETGELEALQNELSVLEGLLDRYTSRDVNIRYRMAMAKYYLAKNKKSEALFYFKQVASDTASSPDTEAHQEAYQFLSDQARKDGNNLHADRYDMLKDAAEQNLEKAKALLIIEKLNFKIERERIEAANRQLLYERYRNQLITYSMIGLACIAIFSLSYIAHQKKHNKKRHDQQLANEKRLRDELERLVMSLDDIIFEFDLNLCYKNVWIKDDSKLFFKKEDFIGKTVQEVFGNMPGFVKAVETTHLQAIQSKSDAHYEYTLDGIWYNAKFSPLINDSIVIGTVASISNITDRKLIENKLSENEEKYRLLSENSQDIIALFDATGNHEFVSASVQKILGYSVLEWTSIPAFETIHPDDMEVQMGLKQRFDLGQIVEGIQFRLKHKQGHYVWVEAAYAPLLDANHKLRTVQASFRDISLRKKALTDLEVSENLYRLLSENTHDLICLHSPDGNFRFVSSSVRELLGFEPDQLIGTNPYDIIHPEDRERLRNQPQAQTLSGKSARNIQYRIQKKDGSYIWMDMHTNPIVENGEVISFQTSSRDISLRVDLENGLKEAKLKAETASRYKSEFLSSMSHEIRTPLNAIVGLSDILLRRNPTTDQLKIYTMLKNASDNLLDIVNNVLDFSKIEAGRMESETIDFNLNETIVDTVKLLEAKAQSKSLDLNLIYDDQIRSHVNGDQVKVRQVLTNLIGNAIKFTDTGHVTVSVNRVSANNNTQHITFSVKDSGIGIAQDKLQVIFDSFAQANSDTSRKYGGTGLGLAISLKLVELMGGKLTVISQLGRGSEFQFVLPLTAINYELQS